MRRLVSYVSRYRRRYAMGSIFLLVTAALAMSVPYLLKRAIDGVGAAAPAADLRFYALAIIAVAIVQGLTRTLSRSLIFNVGRDVEFDLRNDLFAHLQRLPLGFYQEQRTGDLMSRVINDVTSVRMMLGPGILNLLNTPVYYLGGLAVMLSLDPYLTVAAILPYPVLLWVVKRFSRRLMEHTMEVQEGLADLSSKVQENLAGIHVVRSYALEQREIAEFTAKNDEFQKRNMRLAVVRGQLMPVMRTASSVGTLVVLTYGSWRVVGHHLSLGDLVAFLGYLNLLAWPTMALGWMLSVLQRGRAAMIRLEHIFAVEPSIRDTPNSANVSAIRGEIEFRNVDFTYGAGASAATVLRDVSFRIPAGAKLALVGRTGSGKTSIAALLPRLFDVQSGHVMIDGIDVRDISLASLRAQIAFVPQEPLLFSTSIGENIGFGLDHPSESAVRAAAQAAGVASDIEAFPRAYETPVGERGITLSGGQKQRITLARAIATEPRILILDDALSSVDSRTERGILDALREVMRAKTSIVIAHRVSTIADADVIGVVDDGRLVEWGDHDASVAQGGLYSDMYHQQTLEDEIAEL